MTSKPTPLARRMQLLIMLEGGVGCSVEQLALDFDVSRRTVFRDIKALKKSGVHIRFDSQRSRHRVFLDYGTRLPHLSDDEVAAMVMAGHLSPLYSTTAFGSDLRQAMAKLVQKLSLPLRDQLTCLIGHCQFEPPATLPSGIREEVIRGLVDALRRQCPVRVAWTGGNSETCSTMVTPEKLILTKDEWALMGHSTYHRKVHRFDLAHIEQVELPKESNEP